MVRRQTLSGRKLLFLSGSIGCDRSWLKGGIAALLMSGAMLLAGGDAAQAYTTCDPGNQFGVETCRESVDEGVAYSPVDDITINVQRGVAVSARPGEHGILIPGPVETEISTDPICPPETVAVNGQCQRYVSPILTCPDEPDTGLLGASTLCQIPPVTPICPPDSSLNGNGQCIGTSPSTPCATGFVDGGTGYCVRAISNASNCPAGGRVFRPELLIGSNSATPAQLYCEIPPLDTCLSDQEMINGKCFSRHVRNQCPAGSYNPSNGLCEFPPTIPELACETGDLVNGVCVIANDQICEGGQSPVNGQCTSTITETRGPPTSDVTINLAENARIDAPLDGINVTTAADGGIIVNNDGAIDARGGHGVHSVTDAGNITITNRQTVTAQQDGIHAKSISGTVDVTNHGGITAGANGIFATTLTGGISITNDSDGTIKSHTGINAVSTFGNIVAFNKGFIYAEELGVHAFSGRGAVTVTNAGTITANGSGIDTQTDTGRIAITNIPGGEISALLTGITAKTLTGDIDVTNAGTITRADTGIDAYSDFGDITVTNRSLISAGKFGVHAFSGRGDVTVRNEGDIEGSGAGNTTVGITADSDIGRVSVTNTQTITAWKTGVDAKNRRGDIEITNDGVISDTQLGVGARTGSGDIRLTNTGDIDDVREGIALVTGASGLTEGNDARAGDIHFRNSGGIDASDTAFFAKTGNGRIHVGNENLIASGNGAAIKTTSLAANSFVTIENQASGNITGATYGIVTRVQGGRVVIDNLGRISGNDTGIFLARQDTDAPGSLPGTSSVAQIFNLSGATISGGNNGRAINADWTGDIILDNAGTLEGSVRLESHDSTDAGRNGHVHVANSGRITSQNDNGLNAIADAGDITVTNMGANLTGDKLSVDAGKDGMNVKTASGRIDVNNRAGINAASGAAIRARSTTGPIAVTNSGNATGKQFAINATSDGGSVDVINSSEADASDGTAIYARSETGHVSVTNSGDATGKQFAIDATSGGGTVDVTNTGEASASDDTAIHAHSDTGNVTVANSHNATGKLFAINATSTDGEIDLTNSGGANASDGAAVRAHSDTGHVAVTNSSNATGTKFAVKATSTDGKIDLTNSGEANASDGTAIRAHSDKGHVAVTNSNNATGTKFAVKATSIDGEIELTNSGRANASDGTAIHAETKAGRVTVANSGNATGTEFGLDLSSALGVITIDNSGWIEGGQAGVKIAETPTASASTRATAPSAPSRIIQNRSGATIRNAANGRAIDAASGSGPLTIENSGDIIGSFAAGAGSSATFNNLIGGRFEASGSSDFGGAGSVFNNEGTVGIASRGTPADVSLDNLGVFNNTGTVTLQNTVSGDTFSIGGNYVGNAGSSVLLDFASEVNSADRFIVSGNASGHTTVLAENLTPGTPFTLSAPLVEVHGEAAPGVFTLGNPQSVGPLDAVLLPQSGATGTDFVIGSVPNALGLAGAATTLPAARAIAAKGTDVVLNHVTEARDQLRAALGIAPPARRALAYAQVPATPDPVGEQLKPAPVAASGTKTASTKIATWARAFGDVEDRDGRAIYGFAGSVFNVDLGYRQETAGLTAGADLLIPGLTSDTDGLLVGAFAGYLASNVEQDRSAGKQEFSGATLGLSATYLSGNFFTDLTFKTDILDLDIKDAGFRQSADLNNYAVTANAGYTFTLANNWYIEPTAGIEWVRTAFDRQTWLTANTVPLRNSNAFAGRAGARVGTSWTTDDNVLRIEPSLTALAYTIFNVSNGGLGGGLNNVAGINLPDDEGKVRALLQGSINVINLESGLSGFVRADAAFGEDITAAGGKIGLRYQW